MIKKFVFFLAWIGIFILSIMGIVYVLVPEYLVQFNRYTNTLGYNIIVLGISVLYFMICLLKLFSLFERTKDYEIKTEDGVVYVSASSVTNFVIETLSNDEEIRNLRVKTEKKGKKFNLLLSLDLISNGNVSGKSNAIQNEIRNKIATKMGLEVGEIKIKISKLTDGKINEV